VGCLVACGAPVRPGGLGAGWLPGASWGGGRPLCGRGDLTLVEPGLTDIWAWRPDAATVDTTSEFMRILGAVAKKD
jgi:hypothetical protein